MEHGWAVTNVAFGVRRAGKNGDERFWPSFNIRPVHSGVVHNATEPLRVAARIHSDQTYFPIFITQNHTSFNTYAPKGHRD